MKLKNIFSLVLFLFSFQLYSQNMDDFFEKHKSQSIQKCYLHTDRQFYFLGDTIWFAAYLTDGSTHTPVPGNSNLYVELVNSEGESKLDGIFTMFDGFAQGYLPLHPDVLNDGNFLLRTFNEYTSELGAEYIYSKALKISTRQNIPEPESNAKTNNKPLDININFYPEGGFLLAGAVNQLSFEVSGIGGEEKQITGVILDNNQQEITKFSTRYKGRGKLFFAPQLNTEYVVKLDGFPDKEFILPEIKSDGAKIVATRIDSAFVNLSIVHSSSLSGQTFHVAVLHRGQGLLFIDIGPEKLDKMLRLTNDYFGDGINRVVLLNEQLEPVSERLIFRDNSETVNLDLALNKNEYKTREEIVLHIYGTNKLLEGENAGLSVVAVNNNILNAAGNTQNIKSYLLIDSELKGRVENPADYFVDDDNVPALLKQDLLMLTQGWSNYIWNELEEKQLESNNAAFGLSFKGNVVDRKEEPISDAEVFLRLNTQTQSKLLFANTDEQGKFVFPEVFFSDTAYYQIQANNKRGNKITSATIQLDPLFISPEISGSQLKSLKSFEDIPLSLYNKNYQKEQALKTFSTDKDSRVLKEIEVTGENKQDDGHYRIYNVPNVSLQVTEKDYAYRSVFQFLQGRASGVMISGNRIIIRGVSSFGNAFVEGANDPLFLLDGIPVDKSTVSSMKMSQIDKIEVLKGNEAAMFGSRGSTGVISIFSRSSIAFGPNMNELPAGVYEKITGFSSYRAFYSPQYNGDETETDKPDYRTTLFWKPDVQLINGDALLSFFTCDELAEYTIFVEGITSKGRACLGQTNFVVNSISDLSGE